MRAHCNINECRWLRRRIAATWLQLAILLGGWAVSVAASLSRYDEMITLDSKADLIPVARLLQSLSFNDSNKEPFHFGDNSGDVTMEFILTGDPVAGGPDGYLAVGANANSNLRFEQWSNTGQLGFTQLGVADYLFAPPLPTPTQPVHIAYVWQSAARTMKLYLNGALAGSQSGISTDFAMPTGQGWLGNNASGTEGMVGTIYRVTVYDEIVPEVDLRRHADAYNDVVVRPVILSYQALPNPVFTPASATLSWKVRDAQAIHIDGLNVTTRSNLTVSPTVTTTYTLVATNAGGSVTGQVEVVVNPAPVIHRFASSPAFAVPDGAVTLSWNASHAQSVTIAPGVGDVTARTINGIGSIDIRLSATVTYTLTARNPFGLAVAETTATLIAPASHLVISEIMADNESTLADEDGDFSDWIEICNPTAAAVNLAGYFLTDQKLNPSKWAFPNLELASGKYLIVFISGKDRSNPSAPLHTNFQIDKKGEYLALVGPSMIHAFNPYPPQSGDLSYGLIGGDLHLEQFLSVPTPGKDNPTTPPPPDPVRFSSPSSTFASPFSLTLETDTPKAEIRYTLNDSAPGVTNGHLYTAPLTISASTRLRAVAVAAGQASKITMASFIKLAPDLARYTSSLPILVIENFGAGLIPQKGWSGDGSGIKQVSRQSAVWMTFDRSEGVSSLAGVPQMFSRIGIRGRGAFSSAWRQKPYSVEVMDENEREGKVSPLGLPPHADWILYFPDPDDNKDPTLLFNTFAYQLSRNAGRYAVRFRWVEAFIHETGGDLRLADRRGVYAIMEKVSRGKDRLDFEPLSENGGWLLNLNRMDPEPETGWPAPNGATQPWFFHTAGPDRILQTPPDTRVAGDDEPQQSNGFLNFENPNGYTITPAQRASIENWFKEFEDVLWNDARWRDPVQGYRKYIDPVDFADYFIINVLTRNGDGLLISMFPWRGNDGKLRMGPAWDYNWSAYYISGEPTGQLMHRSDRLWYKRLFADIDFQQLYIDRWWDWRRGPMSNEAMDAVIDEQQADISPAKALLNGMPSTAEWARRLDRMKTWLHTRADWIDSNYLRPPAITSSGSYLPDSFSVSILATNGAIYYTTNGVDPRAPGGAIAGAARQFQAPFVISAPAQVQARIKSGAKWSALTTAAFNPPADTDGDLLSDAWENRYSLNPNDPRDATQDPDHDGMTNYQEFIAGTDPRDARSLLKVDAISVGNETILLFLALSNQTYSVQYHDTLSGAGWVKLAGVEAQPTNRVVRVVDPASRNTRYYRLATPQQH